MPELSLNKKTDNQLSDIESRLIASFSRHVKTYNKHAQLQKSMAERLAALLPENLPKKVLEIGCGTGLFTRHLLVKNIRHLTLNDITSAATDYLAEHLTLPPSTKIIIGNAERLKFPKAQLIVANAVLQWFQSPDSSLISLANSLSPDGIFIFSVFGPKTLQEFRETGRLESPAHLRSAGQWKKLLQNSGFRSITTDREIRQIFFPSTQSFIKNLQQIGAAPLRALSPGELRKLMRSYDENYSSAQGIYTNWEILYISAQKADLGN